MPIVLGYHGCSVEAAWKLLGGSPFQDSDRPYDWLGSGSYFWESDVVRAYDWALERRSQSPCVVGAVIDLGNCLDLTTQVGIRAVEQAYNSYVFLQEKAGERIPTNRDRRGASPGNLALRHLDKAVMDHLHENFKAVSMKSGGRVQEFDTVRALFPEGEPLYPSAGFLNKTHVQIAVRKTIQILGVFRIPRHQLDQYRLPDFYAGLE